MRDGEDHLVPGPVPPLVLDGVVVIGGESLARLLLLRGVREVVVVEAEARVSLLRGGTVLHPGVGVGVTETETGKEIGVRCLAQGRGALPADGARGMTEVSGTGPPGHCDGCRSVHVHMFGALSRAIQSVPVSPTVPRMMVCL